MAQLDLLPSAPSRVPFAVTGIPPRPDLPAKAEGAYKTIREVSDEIDVPQHVLRFWESRFPQVKPSRMRGSRRYYRPEDVDTLKTIKSLLYGKGYTIEGARKLVKSGQDTPEAPRALKAAAKKNVDTKSLASELRVLKSMLAALL